MQYAEGNSDIVAGGSRCGCGAFGKFQENFLFIEFITQCCGFIGKNRRGKIRRWVMLSAIFFLILLVSALVASLVGWRKTKTQLILKEVELKKIADEAVIGRSVNYVGVGEILLSNWPRPALSEITAFCEAVKTEAERISNLPRNQSGNLEIQVGVREYTKESFVQRNLRMTVAELTPPKEEQESGEYVEIWCVSCQADWRGSEKDSKKAGCLCCCDGGGSTYSQKVVFSDYGREKKEMAVPLY